MTTIKQNEAQKTASDLGDRKSWKGKFSLVSPWFSDIVSTIKQQLKTEHLSLDPTFVRIHFHGMPLHRISLDDIRAVYLREILSGQNQLAEFVANRWLFKNLTLYKFFEGMLEKVGGNIETIEEVADEKAREMLSSALKLFSIDDVFCFITLNEVCFSDDVFAETHKKALESLASRTKGEEKKEEQSEIEKLRFEVKKAKEKNEKRVEELNRKHELELTKLHKEIKDLKSKLKETK